jgi:hypothetical protein
MHENEDTAADHIIDPARSRRDPPGTLRDAEGRLRVPLDRPDPDLGGGQDHAGCDGDDHRGGKAGFGADGDDDLGLSADDLLDDDFGGDCDPHLTLEQYAALDAVPGLAAALNRSPYCGELIKGAVLVGEAALKATPSDEQARVLHRIRRLAFGHRLFERLLERACLRAIDKRAIPVELNREVSGFLAAYDPDEGTAGAAKALDVIQKLMPEVNEWADKAAKQLYFASYVAPSPTAGACAEIAAGQLPGTPATVSFWLALGSDDLGALDILMDVLAEVAGRPGLSDITSETIRSTLPRLFAQLPAVAALHGRNDEYMASLAGEAVKFILRRVAEEAELESRGATTPAAEGPDASTDRA